MMSALLIAEKWALKIRWPGPECIHLTVLSITSKQMFSPADAILQIKRYEMTSPGRPQQSDNSWFQVLEIDRGA